MRIPRTIKIKIDGFPAKETNKSKYLSLGIGILLTISETLPFMKSESNGLIHGIHNEFKDFFKK